MGRTRAQRRRSWAVRAAALALLAGGLVQAPLAARAERDWLRAQSQHFEIASGASEARTRRIALQLERFRAAFHQLTGRAPIDAEPPLAVAVFGSKRRFRPVLPQDGVDAYLIELPDFALLVVNGGEWKSARTQAQHALSHRWLSGAALPLWYEEGIAQLLATARGSGDALELGRAPHDRMEWLTHASLVPLHTLLATRETSTQSRHAREAFAAESFALAHYLHRDASFEVPGLPAREAQVADLLSQLATESDHDAATRAALGVDVEALERELLRYLSYGALPRRWIPNAALGADASVAISPLPTRERERLVARIESTLQRARTAPAPALERVRALLADGQRAEARDETLRLLAVPRCARVDEVRSPDLGDLARAVGLAARESPALPHRSVHLDVYDPPHGTIAQVGVGWAYVYGRGGLSDAVLHDVVIALDESESSNRATGSDLDGDGRLGTTYKRRAGPYLARQSTDRDDAILAAELTAARRFADELDPETTRAALVTFSDRARVRAPLGAPADVSAAIHAYHRRVRWGTSHAAALDEAFEVLNARRDPERVRQRSVLLLSDGEGTAPTERGARAAALEAAERLARHGVVVHAFAVGEEAVHNSDAMREIAARTGGRYVRVDDPAAVGAALRDVRLSGLEHVAIRNLRTGEDARALRVFPDGSFDAFVRLAPGGNPIEISADIAGMEPRVVRRHVLLRQELTTARAERDRQRLVERLAVRRVEIATLQDLVARRQIDVAAARELEKRLDLDIQDRRRLRIEILRARAETEAPSE